MQLIKLVVTLVLLVLMYTCIHFKADGVVVSYTVHESVPKVTANGYIVGVKQYLVIAGSPLNTFKRQYKAFVVTVPKDYTKGTWLNYLTYEQYSVYLKTDMPKVGESVKVDTTLSELYSWIPLVSFYGLSLLFVAIQHIGKRKK